MSETVPESRPASRGSILTRKVGPLPVWVWMGIGLALAFAYYMIQKNKSQSAPASSTGTTASSSIPQFVNQVYTNGTPPTSNHPRGGKNPASAPPTSTPPGSTSPTGTNGGTGNNNWASPFIVAVPNGSGGWMEAIFPNQTAVNSYYSNIGVVNGDYPIGLNNAQITQAVKNAGGNIAGTVANSEPSGLVQ